MQVRGTLRIGQMIRQLEATLLATAKTASSATDFGTKPNEIVTVHENHNSHTKLPIDEDLMTSLEECADYREFKKTMAAMASLYQLTGAFCTKQLLLFREKELEKALASPDCAVDFKEHADTKKELYRRLNRFLGRDVDPFDLPAKMRRLLDILATFGDAGKGGPDKSNDEQHSKKRLCGIVFVKERMTAYVLYRWMNEVSKNPEYDFINCSFIVGHNQNPFGSTGTDPEAFQMNSKAQRKVRSIVLAQFSAFFFFVL